MPWLPYRLEAKALYQHPVLQILVAFVIIGNFIAIVTEKEIDPYPPEHQFYPALWITIECPCARLQPCLLVALLGLK